MIPIHDLQDASPFEIKVNELGDKGNYDTTEHHRHNYFELFFFETGGGKHEVDFVDFDNLDCSIQIVAPGQVHQMKREPGSKGFVVLFETSVFEKEALISNFLFDHICYDVNENSPIYTFEKEVQAQVLGLFKSIWKDFQSEAALKNDFIKANLSLVCIQCIRTLGGQIEKSKNQKTYESFRRYLNSNFRSVKKVKEYAAQLGVTEKQLNEIVSTKTGSSASVIIYKQIILEAKRLLNMGLSTKEVAYDLSFEDPSHFSKFFKKQSGISPSEFQKIHL
ncbi:MAG: AraC family transcriptional activator of pobA [Arenicella sp.]|jgi:AraC family transcriptional activator of pobA